jgi:hypothetical protein
MKKVSVMDRVPMLVIAFVCAALFVVGIVHQTSAPDPQPVAASDP